MSAQREAVGRNHLEEQATSPIMELPFGSVITGCKFLLLRLFQLKARKALALLHLSSDN